MLSFLGNIFCCTGAVMDDIPDLKCETVEYVIDTPANNSDEVHQFESIGSACHTALPEEESNIKNASVQSTHRENSPGPAKGEDDTQRDILTLSTNFENSFKKTDEVVEKVKIPRGTKRRNKRKQTPKRYISTYQNTENRFTCKYCGRVSPHRRAFLRHKYVHTKPYKCIICNKSFAKNEALKVHEKLHTGEKPYKCEECGKEFRSKQHLKSHSIVHNVETPYKCELCGKEFSVLAYWKRHVTDSVTNLESRTCNICGKSFCAGFDYKCHMLVHSVDKPYPCDICKMNFKTKGALAMHRVIHTNDRPHNCEICGRNFLRKIILERHVQMHRQKMNETEPNETYQTLNLELVNVENQVENTLNEGPIVNRGLLGFMKEGIIFEPVKLNKKTL